MRIAATLVALLTLLLAAPALAAKTKVPAPPSVPKILATLEQQGQITAAVQSSDTSAFTAATNAVTRLTGTRRIELAAVVANVQEIAREGMLTADRLPVVFTTLERNTSVWTTGAIPPSGTDMTFPGDSLVWEYYAGQGVEIQWLATFGKANAYWSAHQETLLRSTLQEAVSLASDRAGGIAWEYLFQFDGGQPPWASGLTQGTAIQALARGSVQLKDPSLLTDATQALGLFQTAPPAGVKMTEPAGTMYMEYTYAPTDRILNGFIQSLVGLYDYTTISGNPTGASLFQAGDAEARAIVPQYDTGAWSLYDQYDESNLNYHELLTTFLQNLCQRTTGGLTATTPAATTPTTTTPVTPSGGTTSPPTTTTTPPVATPPSSPTGGTYPAATTTPATSSTASTRSTSGRQVTGPTSVSSNPTPSSTLLVTDPTGDEVYCTTAQHFTADLHTPPTITLMTTHLTTDERGGVQMHLSKIASVSLTVRNAAGAVVWTNAAEIPHGTPQILWITPRQAGRYAVSLTATDLAGNHGSASGTIVVKAPPHKPSKPAK